MSARIAVLLWGRGSNFVALADACVRGEVPAEIVSGSYWVVPTLTPPPTATMPPPQAPANRKWNYSCSGGNATFELTWEDRAANETGYRIFRDGEAVAELPANSTSWTETIPLESGGSVAYYLQVYGPSGTVNTSIIKVGCWSPEKIEMPRKTVRDIFYS